MKSDNLQVTTKSLRTFGLVFATALYGVTFVWTGNPVNISLYPSGLVLLMALALPSSLATLFRFWLWFGSKIAIVNITIILGLTYFLIFTPLAIWFRIINRDRLNRKWKSGSYWEPYDAQHFTLERYRKLF